MKKSQIKTPKTRKINAKKITKKEVCAKPSIEEKEEIKEKLKPYASVNEMIKNIFLFHRDFIYLKTITEKQEFYKEVKERLALSAKKYKHFFLELFTQNNWNDSEYLGLLFAIGLYIEKMRKLSISDLFELVNDDILKMEEVISVYTERRSQLFKKRYLDEMFSSGSSFAISSKIISAINGKKASVKNMKEENSENKPKQVSSPVLKSVKSICTELSKYIVGQEKAKKVLATALFEHILRIRLKEKGNTGKFDKKNVLLLGPTGCGKTYLCQMLAKISGIPFFMADATQYSATGYVGGDVQDIIMNLAQKTNTKEGGAIPLSIVFIDEFDKLKFNQDARGFDMPRKVQENLLKMLESDKFYFHTKSMFASGPVFYDISKVLFIASGAFSDLEEESKEYNYIGFAQANTEIKEKVDVQKIAKYGFLPEILGRLTYRVSLENLSKEQLIEILTKVENNPIQQYEALFKECGKELIIPQEIVENIVNQAIANHTGARGLNTVLGEYLQDELATIEMAA